MVEVNSRSIDVTALRTELDRYLRSEMEAGSFPGFVYAVGSSKGIVLENALGYSVVKPARIRTNLETIYDVASLTKPLITATLVLRAVADGRIDMNEPVSKHLPELKATDKENVTFLDLLIHSGGFQAWYPLYTQGEGPEAYLKALAKRPLRYAPGSRVIYSCLGYILLHLAMQRVTGVSAESRAGEIIFEPLGLEHAAFHPAPESKYQIAATEWGNANERKMVADRSLRFPKFRNYIIWGETDDGNAWHMGGMAGNAGLFATARDVFAIVQTYLNENGTILPLEMVERSRRNHTPGMDENRGLGWQLPGNNPQGPAAMFSEGSFGHTGFTGTSAWADPGRDLVIVLLTNRLHPTFRPLNMQAIRRQVHLRVVEAWDR